MDAEQIDISKENIQPLRQGRVSSQLSEALHVQASINMQIQQTIQKKIQEYEKALHTYEGNDPLSPWVEYINWVEQYFPKHGKEGNFPKLLQKCLELFKDYDIYKDDPRYVNLWLKYLEMQPDVTSEMYEMVVNHGIGTKLAKFYHSWAMELIKCGDLRRADQIYNMALRAGAQPIEELDLFHKNLQYLVMKRSTDPGDYEEAAAVEQPTRAALGSLHATGRRNTVPLERSQPVLPLHSANRGSLQLQQPQYTLPVANSTQPKFALFKDENRPLDVPIALPTKQPLKSFPAREVIQAENLVEPARWTECASHKAAPAVSVTTPFKVHKDPNTMPSSAKKILPNTVLQARKPSEESEWKVQLALFEPPDPNHVPMYCKEKVYAGGIEFSLEELRAQKYLKIYHEREAAGKAVSGSSQSAVSTETRSVPLQPLTEPPKRHEKFMVPEECLQEPEVSIEEHVAKNYSHLRKAWKENKARQAQIAAANLHLKEQQEPQSYELPPNSRLCAPLATFEGGVETSLEELMARRYQQQRFMFDINRIQTPDSEYCFEELRALHYMIQLQANKEKTYSNVSTPSSRGTTPSSTPGRLGHLSMLGQSLTVNTKEAMAAMKDLWCSIRVESPQPAASPPKSVPFSIFCDSQPIIQTPSSVPTFNIFSDSRAVEPPRGSTRIRQSKSLGPKRGLQLTDTEEVQQEDLKQSEPWPLYHDSTQHEKIEINDYAIPKQTLPTQFSIFQDIENAGYCPAPIKDNEMEYQLSAGSARKLSVFDGFNTIRPLDEPDATSMSHFTTKAEIMDDDDEEIKAETLFSMQRKPFDGFAIFQEPPPENATSKNGPDLWQGQGSFVLKQEKQFNLEVDVVNQPNRSIFQEGSDIKEEQTKPVEFPTNYEIPYVPPPPDDDENIEEIPNKENFCPDDYTVPSEHRAISGILTEAQNVPFMALEEQERLLDEEEKAEQEAEKEETVFSAQLIGRFVEDVTTSVFRQPNFSSSTPYHQTQSLLSRVFQDQKVDIMAPVTKPMQEEAEVAVPVTRQEEEEGVEDDQVCAVMSHVTTWDHVEDLGITAPRAANLSPILEVTGESRGSRSGSSSGSSANSRLMATTSHMFSKTPGQFSKTPGQFSKTPGMFNKTPGENNTMGDSRMAGFLVERPVRLRLLELEEEELEKASSNFPLNLETQQEHVVAKNEQLLPATKQVDAISQQQREEMEKAFEALNLNLKNIDPFCPQLNRRFLAILPTPLDNRPGFMQFNSPLPTVRASQNLSIGEKTLTIKRILGEGAYAKVYQALVKPDDKLVALKYAPDDTTCWDFYISTEIQSRIPDPSLANRFCNITNTYLYDNGAMYQMDFISRCTLLNVVNHFQTLGTDVPVPLVAYFSIQVLQLVQSLHKMQIIHADIKPDNFMLMQSGDEYYAKLHMIDFGRCIDMKLYPRETTFNTVFKANEFRCVEMRTNRPWTYQLDYYGAAATIHCLLFSKYMNVTEVRGRWMPTCKPKRFWMHGVLFENIFETLLNIESCEHQPDLQPIINSLQQRVNSKLIISKDLKIIMDKSDA